MNMTPKEKQQVAESVMVLRDVLKGYDSLVEDKHNLLEGIKKIGDALNVSWECIPGQYIKFAKNGGGMVAIILEILKDASHNTSLNSHTLGHEREAREKGAPITPLEEAKKQIAYLTSKLDAANKELAQRKEDATAWCQVDESNPTEVALRDLVYEWARTETRGTTPFRELQGLVLAALVHSLISREKSCVSS